MKVNNTLIRNPEKRIKFKTFREGGKEHFHIGVWLEGEDQELDQIKKVQYKLHPSFKRQIRESHARDNDFSVTFWTWGMFNMEVTIFKNDGTSNKLKYYLEFDLPKDNGSNYVDVSRS